MSPIRPQRPCTSRTRSRRRSILPIHVNTPASRSASPEPSPTLDASGLLTPSNEDFNQFVLDQRRGQQSSGSSTPDLPDDSVVAVIGVGYVGFELVQAFVKHYPVIAFDVSKQRINTVCQEFEGSSVYFTSDPTDITQATHILIAVPTRVHLDTKVIDTVPLKSAIQTLARWARPGATIVVESSVAVGMTRDLLEPYTRSRGFKVGMSPERVDPGRTNFQFEAIPKVVSGLNPESLDSIKTLYEKVFEVVVAVSSCEVAEMTKLYENCQRMMCIAYANEMADACQTIGIDPNEVCSAAATKPFGYQAYLPGAGVGGHCIPVNPYYLLSNMQFPLLQACTEKMWQRPASLASEVMTSLSQKQSWSNDASFGESTAAASLKRILVVGVAFKPGQSVISHSCGLGMVDHLVTNYENTQVDFCDPLVDASVVTSAKKMDEKSDWNVETLDENYDAVVLAMAQHGLDLNVLTRLQKAQVFNFTSALKGFGALRDPRSFGAKRDSAVEF